MPKGYDQLTCFDQSIFVNECCHSMKILRIFSFEIVIITGQIKNKFLNKIFG